MAWGAKGAKLTPADWVQVVVVAGIGSVLEWFDFFSYSQLDSTIKAVFFDSESDTGYWTIFGLAMAARPIGALLFGHIGDTAGRSKALVLGIICMAIGTLAIGCLPTYDIGSYTAGIAATILLGVFRVVQGLAMGGEFGAAIVYISEMAGVNRRITYTALLQATANIGLLLAVSLIMVLQATISSENMKIWGWRIPFILAFFTALMGYYLRRGMPEPHAFLEAARKERTRSSKLFSKRQLTLLGPDAEWEASPAGAGEADGTKESPGSEDLEARKSPGKEGQGTADKASEEEEEPFERAASVEKGVLTKFHSNISKSKVPMLRVIRNNWMGICLQILCTAWVAATYYSTTSWLPSKLRQDGMNTRVSQGILLATIIPTTLGELGAGWALDHGLRAVYCNFAVIIIGAGAGFGVFYGSFSSTVAAWILIPLMMFIVGVALCMIGAPLTRLYSPLERITGYAFGYNCAMGIIGGFTPNISNGIKGSISADLVYYSGAFWLLGVSGLSLLGCALLRAYVPRLNKPFVGHIE